MILINRFDGGVSLMRLIGEAKADEEIGKWSKRNPGMYRSHIEIKDESVPTDRTFRDAWVLSGAGVIVDMNRARELWREVMRRARADRFAELDVQYMRAIETEDSAAASAIVKKKEELRGVTLLPDIDAATTPAELRSCWPDCLN